MGQRIEDEDPAVAGQDEKEYEDEKAVTILRPVAGAGWRRVFYWRKLLWSFSAPERPVFPARARETTPEAGVIPDHLQTARSLVKASLHRKLVFEKVLLLIWRFRGGRLLF